MTTVLAMAPMPVELRAFVKAAGLARAKRGDLDVHEGSVGGVDVVATIAGIGTKASTAATEQAIAAVAPDHVVVTGIAGGLDPSLRIGDLHVPAVAVETANGAAHRAAPLGPTPLRGTIRTGDELLTPAEMAVFIDGENLSVDMETAAIAAVCEQRSLPWTAFRGISDLVADGVVGDDVLALTNPDGSVRALASVRYVVTHPHHIPRLMRLARGGYVAAKVAAEAATEAIGTGL
jgi:adenosylhomocysteine nucleosidase